MTDKQNPRPTSDRNLAVTVAVFAILTAVLAVSSAVADPPSWMIGLNVLSALVTCVGMVIIGIRRSAARSGK